MGLQAKMVCGKRQKLRRGRVKHQKKLGGGVGVRCKSTMAPRCCSTERLLFIEAGLQQKNDRHLECTRSISAPTNNTLRRMHNGRLWDLFPSSCSSITPFVSQISLLRLTDDTWEAEWAKEQRAKGQGSWGEDAGPDASPGSVPHKWALIYIQ